MQEVFTFGSDLDKELKRPLEPWERATEIAKGPLSTAKGQAKVTLYFPGEFSWEHTYMSGKSLCSFPINRVVSFKRQIKRLSGSEADTITFFAKILPIADKVIFVVYDESGNYISHGDTASSVLTRVINQVGGYGKLNGQAMLLLSATKDNLERNFARLQKDVKVLSVPDDFEKGTVISEHTLTEVPEEAMAEAIGSTISTLCELDSRSGSQCESDNSSDSESSDQMSEDNNYDNDDDDDDDVDDDASPHASVLKHDSAFKQLQEAFTAVPKSKVIEALTDIPSEEKRRKWTTAVRVSVLSEIQVFAPELVKVPTVVTKQESLYRHLLRFLENEFDMRDVTAQAIRCMLLELIRTYDDDDISHLIEMETSVILERARPTLKKDEESIEHVEKILKNCSTAERGELLRRFHSQCVLAESRIDEKSDVRGRFLSYLRLDHLYAEVLSKDSDGLSHGNLNNSEIAKSFKLATQLKFIIEHLLSESEQASFDDLDRPWFWALQSKVFHSKTGQSPEFSSNELDFWSTVYNLYGSSCVSLLRGPNCMNMCIPSPSRLRLHNANEADVANSRGVGPIESVIRESVADVFFDFEQTLGLKMDETDLTRESGPEGDVNYNADVRAFTEKFKSDISAIKQNVWRPEHLSEWIECNLRGLTAKEGEVEKQLSKKEKKIKNTKTSAVKLKASVTELQLKLQDIRILLVDIEKIRLHLLADETYGQSLLRDQLSYVEELVERSYSILRRPATKLLVFMLSDTKRTFSRECAYYLVDDSFTVSDGRIVYSEVASIVQSCIEREEAKANMLPTTRPLMVWRSFDGHWQPLSLTTSSDDAKTKFQQFRKAYHLHMDALKTDKAKALRDQGESAIKSMSFCDEDVNVLISRFGSKTETTCDSMPADEIERPDTCAMQESASTDKGKLPKRRKVEKRFQETIQFASATSIEDKVVALWRFTSEPRPMLAVLKARAEIEKEAWLDFIKLETCPATGQAIFDFEDAGHLIKRIRSMIVKGIADGGRVFFGQFHSSAWVAVAKHNPKVLTKKHLQGVDIQSVPYAIDFFREEVENLMRDLKLPEADLVRMVRDFWDAVDTRGISWEKRMLSLKTMEDFLLKTSADFYLAPPGQYIAGVPTKLFEGLLLHCCSKRLLSQYLREVVHSSGEFNNRALSTDDVECFFSILVRMRGGMKPTPTEFRYIGSKAVFEKKKRLQGNRTWAYCLSTNAHYSHHALEDSEEKKKKKTGKKMMSKRDRASVPVRAYFSERKF